jgi:hypothetical protein
VQKPFRSLRARAAIVIILANAGAPTVLDAQDLGIKQHSRLTLSVRVQSAPAFQRPGGFRMRARRCSRLKGALIGAAVGFGAGAVYGAVAGPSKFGVLGTRERTDVLLFGVIGAGGGALIGVAVCS